MYKIGDKTILKYDIKDDIEGPNVYVITVIKMLKIKILISHKPSLRILTCLVLGNREMNKIKWNRLNPIKSKVVFFC